jgi:hypothetical protein
MHQHSRFLSNDFLTVFNRSIIGSAADANHQNKQVSKSDEQDSLKLLETRKISADKASHSKYKSRNVERLVMMCQLETDLKQIKQFNMFALELDLGCIVYII